MARLLPRDLCATVVTHSPSIAVALAEHPAVNVEIIGGRLFKHSMVTIGAIAAEAIAAVRADAFFMGVTGVHPEMGLTTGDAEEAAIKRALSRQAAETIVLASREKLGAASPFRIMPLNAIDVLVVGPDTPPEDLAPYQNLGFAIVTETRDLALKQRHLRLCHRGWRVRHAELAHVDVAMPRVQPQLARRPLEPLR